jgi:hypothetical protein
MMNKIETESPFDTEATLIDPGIPFRRHFDYLSICLRIEFQLTTASTESAGGLSSLQLPCPSFDGAEIFCQSAHRTDVETFPTRDTILFPDGLHMGTIPLFCHFQHIGPWNINAGLNTTKTHDASIHPLTNQRSAIFYRWPFYFFSDELDMVNPKFIGAVLKLTFSSCIADRTVQRMVDQ